MLSGTVRLLNGSLVAFGGAVIHCRRLADSALVPAAKPAELQRVAGADVMLLH